MYITSVSVNCYCVYLSFSNVFMFYVINFRGVVTFTGKIIKCFFNISNDKIPCERSAFLSNNETTDKHKLRQTSNDQLNINYLGLDSVSKRVADRKMPKTMAYMRLEMSA